MSLLAGLAFHLPREWCLSPLNMSHKIAKLERKLRLADPLNDPTKWDIDIQLPYFDVASYQARIDDLVGRNREGKSIIRLIWAPQSIGLWGVPRYMLSRIKDGEGWLYTTIKRWVFESRLERSQYYDSWMASRYGTTIPADCQERCEACGSTEKPTDNEIGRFCVSCGSTQLVRGEILDKGAPPDEFFRWEYTCAKHESVNPETGQHRCCEQADKDDHKRCFGSFRNPNDADLDLIRAAFRKRESEKHVDPYSPLSPEDLVAIEAMSCIQMERIAEAVEARRAEVIRNESRLQDFGGSFHDVGSSFDKNPGSLLYTPN